MAAAEDLGLAVFDLRSGPRTAVALSVHAGASGGGELRFHCDEGDVVETIELDDVSAVTVQSERAVHIRHGKPGKSKRTCVFGFERRDDLEGFAEALLELRPALAAAVELKVQRDGESQRSIGKGRRSKHRGKTAKAQQGGKSLVDNLALLLEERISVLQAEEEDDATVLGDSDEDEDDSSDDGLDHSLESYLSGSESDNSDNAAKDVERPGQRRTTASRRQRRHLAKAELHSRKRSLITSVRNTEWMQFMVSRYNRFGQSEPCCMLLSATHGVLQLMNLVNGENLAAYKVDEISGYTQHGFSGYGLGLSIRRQSRKGRELVLARLNEDGKIEPVHALENDFDQGAAGGAGEPGHSGEAGGASGPLAQDNALAEKEKKRRSTGVGGFFTGRGRGWRGRRNPAAELTENVVFESHEVLREFCRSLKRCLGGELDIGLERAHTASEVRKVMNGGWAVFRGFIDKKVKARTVAINPMLGCLYLFKQRSVRMGIIQGNAVPKFSVRIAKPAAIKVSIMPKRPTALSIEFAGAALNGEELGVPVAGSFDAYRAGILSNQEGERQDVWYFRGASGTDARGFGVFKLKFDLRSTEEAMRMLGCINTMRAMGVEASSRRPSAHGAPGSDLASAVAGGTAATAAAAAAASESNKPRQRKSGFASHLVNRLHRKSREAAKPVGPPTLLTLDAGQLQAQAWELPVDWFSSEQRVYVGTFNVGDASAAKSAMLEHWLPSPVGQAPKHAGLSKKFTTTCGTGAHGKYALYAIGLQEVSSKFEEWTKALSSHLGAQYRCAISVRLWEIGLLVFVHVSELRHIGSVVTGAEKTGIRIAKAVTGVQLGNKGGVGVGFRWRDVPLAFINAHLSAQQTKVAERNTNFQQIMAKIHLEGAHSQVEGLALEPTLAFEHLFFLGDLNYRVNLDYKTAERAVADSNWAFLHKHDQLAQEREAGRAFAGFRTAPPMFAPTYRWKRGRRELSNKKDQPPSYTDRVLWHSRSGLEAAIELESYGCAESLMISDHRPVSATFRLRLRHEYSWPLHPLTQVNQMRTQRTLNAHGSTGQLGGVGGSDGGVTAVGHARGDFFISAREASRTGAPEVCLRNVEVELEGGASQPYWVRLQVFSPILHKVTASTFAPGAARVPGTRKRIFAYTGAARNGALTYAFDNFVGFPSLMPTIWDPTYLHSQHLLIKIEVPANLKEENCLTALHAGFTGAPEGEDVDAMITRLTKPTISNLSAQSCVPLTYAVDAVRQRVGASGLDSWTRDRTPSVVFSEPIICNGVEIGRLRGEIQLVPPAKGGATSAFSDARDAVAVAARDEQTKKKRAQEREKRRKVVKYGWVQIGVRAQGSRNTSARVHAVLTDDAVLHLFAERDQEEEKTSTSARNLLLRVDLSRTEVNNRGEVTLHLPGCRSLEERQAMELTVGSDSQLERNSWKLCIRAAQDDAASAIALREERAGRQRDREAARERERERQRESEELAKRAQGRVQAEAFGPTDQPEPEGGPEGPIPRRSEYLDGVPPPPPLPPPALPAPPVPPLPPPAQADAKPRTSKRKSSRSVLRLARHKTPDMPPGLTQPNPPPLPP